MADATTASVRVFLDDGSNTYIAVMPVASFRSQDVVEAAGTAVAWFIASYVRDEESRGGEEWSPTMAHRWPPPARTWKSKRSWLRAWVRSHLCG